MTYSGKAWEAVGGGMRRMASDWQDAIGTCSLEMLEWRLRLSEGRPFCHQDIRDGL